LIRTSAKTCCGWRASWWLIIRSSSSRIMPRGC
jgi:hypothetical protein